MTRARLARSAPVLLATATVSVLPTAAHAETVASVDASVGALAASNPFLIHGTDTESGAASLSLHPYVSVADGSNTVVLDGALYLENYFDHYGTDESAEVGASLEHRANERTTVSAAVSFFTSESAARHFYGGADLDGLEPGEFPDSTVIDPTLGNIDGRTTRLDVGLALRQLVSVNSTIDLSAGIGSTHVESDTGLDYRDSRSGLGYTRRLNERTSFVANVDVGYADYYNIDVGDGLFVTTLAGVDHQFTESMYGSIQLGFSYAAVKTLLSGRLEVTNWAASVDLCDLLARGTLCVTGSRGMQPTSQGGITMVSAVGVSYGRTIGTAGHISMGATYQKSGTSEVVPTLLGRRENEVAYFSGTYTHEIGERLSAFLTPSFTSNDDEFDGKEENYQVQVGISYHFGSAR
jgi:hypothetical protein